MTALEKSKLVTESIMLLRKENPFLNELFKHTVDKNFLDKKQKDKAKMISTLEDL